MPQGKRKTERGGTGCRAKASSQQDPDLGLTEIYNASEARVCGDGEANSSAAPDVNDWTSGCHRDFDAANNDVHLSADLEQLGTDGASGCFGKVFDPGPCDARRTEARRPSKQTTGNWLARTVAAEVR